MRRGALAMLVLAAGAAAAAASGTFASEDAAVVETTTASGSDGPLTVHLSLTPARPVLGQEVTLELRAAVAGAAPLRIAWPEVSEELTDAIGEDIVESEPGRRSDQGRTHVTRFRFFDAGRFDLPPLAVTAAGPEPADGSGPREYRVAFTGLSVEVPSVADEAAEPIAGRDVVAWTPPEPGRPFPWTLVIGAAALGALGTTAWLLLRRRRPAEIAVAAEPEIPPHRQALAALDGLDARKLPEKGLVEPYFVELSEILRGYIEGRFSLRAPEQTTEEFLAVVSDTEEGRRAVSAGHRDVLRDFLVRADLVKFACDEPDVATCHDAGGTARRFVEETVPAAPDADATGDAS